jgi:heat shock protein HtpX
MNLIRTGFLFSAMVAVFVAIGSLFGTEGAAVALAFAAVVSFWSFWRAGHAILRRAGARDVTDAKLLAVVHDLAAKANMPAPRLFEIEEHQPNAFALGSDPAHACIVLATGLRRRLNADEIRAVLAHELWHIANRDTLSATMGVTLLSAIATLAILLGIVGLAARRNGGGALIFLTILAPVVAVVLHLAMSRNQEYRADREGALLCGNPEHLISALIKLDTSTRRIASATAGAQPAIASLFFVDPLPGTWLGRLFLSHPPIAKRIARLKKLT